MSVEQFKCSSWFLTGEFFHLMMFLVVSIPFTG